MRGKEKILAGILPNRILLIKRASLTNGTENPAFRDYTIITGDNFTITCGECGKANYAINEGKEYALTYMGSIGLQWGTVQMMMGTN